MVGSREQDGGCVTLTIKIGLSMGVVCVIFILGLTCAAPVDNYGKGNSLICSIEIKCYQHLQSNKQISVLPRSTDII